jgi:hypothetical protein
MMRRARLVAPVVADDAVVVVVPPEAEVDFDDELHAASTHTSETATTAARIWPHRLLPIHPPSTVAAIVAHRTATEGGPHGERSLTTL